MQICKLLPIELYHFAHILSFHQAEYSFLYLRRRSAQGFHREGGRAAAGAAIAARMADDGARPQVAKGVAAGAARHSIAIARRVWPDSGLCRMHGEGKP